MKIAIASDLHLEFGDLDFENTDGAEVLVLSGDICVASDIDHNNVVSTVMYRSTRYHGFFERCCERFPHVIYVLGNHEHYHGDIATTLEHMQSVLAHLPNLYIMEKQSRVIGDTTFVAGTLWTDMNQEDLHTLAHMRGYMNDFRIISDSRAEVHFKNQDGKYHTRTGKWTPEASVVDHKAMKGMIRETVEADPAQRYVVVGHHAPSRLSTKPRYQKDVVVNGGYSSSLDDFIQDHPQIRLWTHGHTHDMFDYRIGSTRIVCNPRGYAGHEERANEWQLITVNV